MADFEVPEDITALTDEELAEALSGAVAAFDAKSTSTSVTSKDLESLRSLATAVESIRSEQGTRREAAEQAAAEIDALAAQVRGGDAADTDTSTEGDDAVAAADEATAAATDAEPEPEPEPAPKAVAASSSALRPALNLSGVRRRQPRVLPEAPTPTTTITAAVDVPGYAPGSPLDFSDITAGIISRANALKTAGGGVGQVISYRHPYSDDLIVTDSSSAPEGTTVALHASSQRRLPEKDLVASGGWCAPSETIYELTDTSCPDMLWDAPEIQLARGGLRYYKPLSLDVSSMTWVHTEADDISGAEKPCFRVPCPDPVEVRCEAVGVCLEAGILTQRHFPELVAWYLRNSMVAHEIRIRQVLFQQAVATATPVVLPETMAALSAIYGAIGLQSADMIERHSLCESTALEVVFPWWAKNMFLADVARQNGKDICDIDPNCIQNAFSTLGVRVQWARGLAPTPTTGVPTEIGGPTPATGWPSELSFLMYPAGSLQIGRGEEVNLGVVHDSTKFVTNDYTALFAEECVALVDRSVDTRLVTVPVCPTGATGAQIELACPIA
ncbi:MULTISPECIES: major capsid protein [unclassified Streptomyces]|uniref:major capsid protein n=1 Tax=unclassified Streptomyces TaxID=2593676 RepID=UPI0020245FE7|nr:MULTISPECIES: major capsid protein [unclassified Streptomyces]MCX4550599.1 major capsid protein [Streptomyces sp. NBC_01500]WSC22044.1 major capsid protein [Streptomyces sp. NBC_01766]